MLLISLGMAFLQPLTAQALTPAQKKVFEYNIDYFDVDEGSCSVAATDTVAAGNEGSLDVKDVVEKYDLQSVAIKELGGDVKGSHKADEPPTTPASTMKLIIADTVIRSGMDLDKSVPVTSDLFYDGGNDLNKRSITIRDALTATLSVSSNVGANVLMKSLGGVGEFTSKANSFGYTHTTVKGYYDPSSRGKNKSTISDQVEAMSHIFSESGTGYEVAQRALEKAARSDNHYGVNDDANKWAGTSDVAGNVGKFKIGGKDYIIGLYYNGGSSSSQAKNAMRNGSADLVKVVESSATTGSPATPQAPAQAACCPADGGSDAGDGDTSGNGGDSGVWDSGLKPPYILEQWAIEVLKNLAKKKGVAEADAVTKQHVLALVAFAIGEGGDIQNSYLYNPLNTGINAPELLDGGHSASGLQRFKSFDAGVEAAARTFSKKQFSRLAAALTKPDSTAQQFMHALSYNWKYPGGALWAEASYPSSPHYQPDYYKKRLGLVKQVQNNYKGTAGLIIGTEAFEQAENKTDVSKLQLDDGTTASLSDSSASCANESADAKAIAQEAVRLSWPDASHGTTPSDAYREAYTKFNPNGPGMADCGGFVATVMHSTKADKDYPAGGTALQEAYVRAHPEKYDVADKITSKSELQPGDILIVNQGSGAGAAGHTFIFVGKQPPSNYDAASASLNSRAANLGNTVLSDERGNYIRARLK